MQYDNELPNINALEYLADQTQFPATRLVIAGIASNLDLDELVTEFLELFPEEEVFIDRTDFLTRCEELEFLIEQERISPFEILRSPQE